MRFVAGSHHHGHLTFRPSDPDEKNVLNQTVENAEQYGTVLLNGSGFDGPLWSVRASLANLPDAAYEKIGAELVAIIKQYYDDWQKQKKR